MADWGRTGRNARSGGLLFALSDIGFVSPTALKGQAVAGFLNLGPWFLDRVPGVALGCSDGEVRKDTLEGAQQPSTGELVTD